MTEDSSVREFLADRREWLKVRVVPGWGDGWDIALILDGTYSSSATDPEYKAAMLDYWTERVSAVLAAEGICPQVRPVRPVPFATRR